MINKRWTIDVQTLDHFRTGIAAEGVGCGRGVTSGDCAYWGNAAEECGNEFGAGYGGGSSFNTKSSSVEGRGTG